MKKCNIILVVILLYALSAFGQSSREQAINELKAVYQRYQSASFLSFKIQYRYAMEQAPAAFLDSVKGAFRIHRNSYWYTMDSTEATMNSDYVVMLFKEDSMMMISKPDPSLKTINPVAMLDSLLLNNPAVQAKLTTTATTKKVVLDLPDGYNFRKLEYSIDVSSGYVVKVTCLLPAEQLYESSVRSLITGKSYAYLEILMTNYQTGTFGIQQFNIGKYFKKEQGVYSALPPYQHYRIFLGSTNL